MSRPDIAAKNAEYVGYATPNQAAWQRLPRTTRENPSWYPSKAVLSKLETYQNLGPTWTQRYNDDFLEFKMTNQ
ncbi:spermidine/putrescine ABC transporter periplasmic substrate-binding protein [Weissella viridescens]|nr:spermidine/putrescine ABC transporter periplasmic substrate-binding protein [Weissella viridescens]